MGHSTHPALGELGKKIFQLSTHNLRMDRAFMSKYYPQLVVSRADPSSMQFGKLQFLSSLVGVF